MYEKKADSFTDEKYLFQVRKTYMLALSPLLF